VPPVESCRRLETVGSETLADVINAEVRAGRPSALLVYDLHVAWVRRVVRGAGVPTTVFLSQQCAVDIVYGEVWAGRMPLPTADGSALRQRGMVSVELGTKDMLPFVSVPELYPQYLKVLIRQFQGLNDDDNVFVNSFRDLEPM
jgi:hypothetical protein